MSPLVVNDEFGWTLHRNDEVFYVWRDTSVHAKKKKLLSQCQTAASRWDSELLGVSFGSKLFAYATMR